MKQEKENNNIEEYDVYFTEVGIRMEENGYPVIDDRHSDLEVIYQHSKLKRMWLRLLEFFTKR